MQFIKTNSTSDPSQRPAPLGTVATVYPTGHGTLTPHIMFLWSKEDTDNAPTDKKEQVNFGMKKSLSFLILSFFKEILAINIF